MQKQKWSWFEGFSLDLRSLALFRICFGSILFIDVFYRLFYIREFYSDWGVLPRAPIIEQFLGDWETSLFFLTGRTEVITAIFLVMLVFIAFFTLGYRTRLSAFITWVLIISMQTRSQIITHGGDDLIRVLLFWCQFVPLNVEFSLDRYLSRVEPPKAKNLLSFGTAGLLLQLLFMYLFTAALKSDPIWNVEGSAVYYALSLEEFTDVPGTWLLQFPGFLRFLTFSTLILEWLGPILVLLPWIQRYARIPVVLAFIGFHFGLFVTLHLGPFPWTCMAAWLMVLPSSFWNFADSFWTWSPLRSLSESWKKLSWGAEIPRVQFARIFDITAMIFLFLVFSWNLSHHDWFPYNKTPSFSIIMNLSHMYQKWSMFAPFPRKDDGWFVIEAKLFNGQVVNPMAEGFVYTEEKPPHVADTFINTMWRKYLSNIWLKNNTKYRIHFGRYLCRSWNAEKTNRDEKINTIKISYMLQMTPPPGEKDPPTEKVVLWRHYCFDKPADWVD